MPNVILHVNKTNLNLLIMGLDQVHHGFDHPETLQAVTPEIKALRDTLVEAERRLTYEHRDP